MLESDAVEQQPAFEPWKAKQDQICLEVPGFGVGLSCEEVLFIRSLLPAGRKAQ